jgi:hypothetical protein
MVVTFADIGAENAIADIAKQGVVATLLFFLYWRERSDHEKTRAKVEALLEARRQDAKETLEKVESPLSAIAQNTGYIADKLEASKRRR